MHVRRGEPVSRRGWVLFLAMSVIWGIPYLLIKVAVGEVSPVMLVFARCVVGAALLLPWTIATGQLRPALRHWRALLLFTVLEMAAPVAPASPTPRRSLSSSLTGLLVAGVPFVAALAARLAGEEERLTPIRILGMAHRRRRHRACCSGSTSAAPQLLPLAGHRAGAHRLRDRRRWS